MSFVFPAQVVFVLALSVLIYVYLGYPLLVYFVSCFFPKIVRRGDFEPSVSVVIAAYNEEKDIRAKIENTLLIDYPQDKLEIIVASDCSSDRTDEIVGEFVEVGVKLLRQPERKGKTSAQNSAVESASGDFILFSDATTMYQPGVLRSMMPNFADEAIGCVAGRLIYEDSSGSGVGSGAKKYWSYETFLKHSESAACSLVGASGCLYAVRKSAYIPMYAEACSDFLIATYIYKQGLRTVFEPNAECTEETNRESGKEFNMRVRVTSRTLTDLWRNREVLNPLHSGFFAIELISHKILRYCVPIILILLFLSSAYLAISSQIFLAILFLQIIFYGAALLGLSLERRSIKSGMLSMPLYFSLVNLASLVAIYKFLRGERYVIWDTVREGKLKPNQDAASQRNA